MTIKYLPLDVQVLTTNQINDKLTAYNACYVRQVSSELTITKNYSYHVVSAHQTFQTRSSLCAYDILSVWLG